MKEIEAKYAQGVNIYLLTRDGKDDELVGVGLTYTCPYCEKEGRLTIMGDSQIAISQLNKDVKVCLFQCSECGKHLISSFNDIENSMIEAGFQMEET